MTALVFSSVKPKAVYENERVVAYWEVPLFANNTNVKANRIDVTVVDKMKKEVQLVEIRCPWVESRGKKTEEKTCKYALLEWELQRYPGHRVTQCKFVIDV